jgi:hypothetical protein
MSRINSTVKYATKGMSREITKILAFIKKMENEALQT